MYGGTFPSFHGKSSCPVSYTHLDVYKRQGYEPGHGQPSFDKQFARDWLKANPDNDWTLPQDIVCLLYTSQEITANKLERGKS